MGLGAGGHRKMGPRRRFAHPQGCTSPTCSMCLRHRLRRNATATLVHRQRPSAQPISCHPWVWLHITSPSPPQLVAPKLRTVRAIQLQAIQAVTSSSPELAPWCRSVGRSVGREGRFGRVGIAMGLPKPLGPHGVSFVEFELRRTSPGSEPGAKEGQQQQQNGACDGGHAVAGTLPSAEGAPLMRIFYPTASKKAFSLRDVRNRSWLPNVNYLMGFLSRAIVPTNFLLRALVWTLSCTPHSIPVMFRSSERITGWFCFIHKNDFSVCFTFFQELDTIAVFAVF